MFGYVLVSQLQPTIITAQQPCWTIELFCPSVCVKQMHCAEIKELTADILNGDIVEAYFI